MEMEKQVAMPLQEINQESNDNKEKDIVKEVRSIIE